MRIKQANVREGATHMSHLVSLRRSYKRGLHRTLPSIYHGEFLPHVIRMKK